MPIRLESTPEGSAQPADTINAFCRHLGELCDVLSAPYDAEALERAASGQELQGTTCNLMLQNALYQWLGERVELSLSESEAPEEAARRARELALSAVRDRNLLTDFVKTVANSLLNIDACTQAPAEPVRQSLLYDLHGPMDLLGPEEVERLLAELTTSPAPLNALEALSSDVHLLEDLCFGHDWPQLCDALGRLACLPPPHPHQPQPPLPQPQPQRSSLDAASRHAACEEPQQQPGGLLQEGLHPAATAGVPQAPRQHQLLMTVLQEVVSSTAASSPAHAAELLDALAPALTALVVKLPQRRLTAPHPPGHTPTAADGSGACSGSGSGQQAASLLDAAAAVEPFAVDLARVAHQLLCGLAQEFHTLPPNCAALAARAVCDVVRAGIARGAPMPAATAVTWAAIAAGGTRNAGPAAVQVTADLDPILELSALDLVVLLDPELRWWQRLCSATHATQRMAEEMASTQLAGALETALAAWAAAAGAAGASASAGRSPTHLLACTALLGGLVRANNPALLGGVRAVGSDGGASGSDGGGGAKNAAPGAGLPLSTGASEPPTVSQHQVQKQLQQHRARLQRMLGHLTSCFCVLADKPCLLRPRSDGGSDSNAASGGSGPRLTARGSVFLRLAADVLAATAALGALAAPAPGSGGSGGGGGYSGAPLAQLLQAMLRAATAAGTLSAASVPAAEAEAWLAAAVGVLGAVAEHATAAAAASGGSGGGAAAAAGASGAASQPRQHVPLSVGDAMSALLGHIASLVRGLAGGDGGSGSCESAAAVIPAWARVVVRAAVPLSAASPTVAAALHELYDVTHAVLSKRVRKPDAAAEAAAAELALDSLDDGSDAGLPAQVSLLDILNVGGGGGSGDGTAAAPGAVPASHPGGGATAAAGAMVEIDGVEVLAAEAVLAYCRTDCSHVDDSVYRVSAVAPDAVTTAAADTSSSAPQRTPYPTPAPLPPALVRQAFLDCAASWLCSMYDSAGGSARGGGVGGRVGGGGRGASARTAAKRWAARVAGTFARSCPGAQRALIVAGFARRVLNDVAAVLRSGEYESPYLEPLPYSDPLAALSAALADVLCWPGLLQLPHSRQSHGLRGGAEGAGAAKSADGATAAAAGPSGEEEECSVQLEGTERYRAEVLALLQELVTWLDLGCSGGGAAAAGLPHEDAALVSLGCFAALVAADPAAAAALERVTNIRWYLHNLTGTPADEGEAAGAGKAAAAAAAAATAPPSEGGKRAPGSPQRRPHHHQEEQQTQHGQQMPQRGQQVAQQTQHGKSGVNGSVQSVVQSVDAEVSQQSDLLLDLARAVLGAMEGSTAANMK